MQAMKAVRSVDDREARDSFERGAEWRRWDLHVHTPESALANEFKSWESYLTAIEGARASIAVLGATDYCSIEGYKKLLAYRTQGRAANLQLIVPNIEFRVQTETRAGNAINLHVLVSPDDPQHVLEIERALSRLTFSYDGRPYSCSRDGLIALGRVHGLKQTSSEALYEHGVNNFKPGFDELRQWFAAKGG
jgi:hypothetical protein